MAGRGVAALADDPDLLAGVDALALLAVRSPRHVHVDEVLAGALGRDDQVVAGRRLAGVVPHDPTASRDYRRAAGGHDVHALVRVTRARRAEAVAEAVRPVHREGEVVHRDAVVARAAGGPDRGAVR